MWEDKMRGHSNCAISHISIEKLDLITKRGLQMHPLPSSKCLLIKDDLHVNSDLYVCVVCSCRVESITIGMWTWLLERLWKSHRPMIKNSVQASLQAHHSECLHKRTEHSDEKKSLLVAGLSTISELGLSPAQNLVSGPQEQMPSARNVLEYL